MRNRSDFRALKQGAASAIAAERLQNGDLGRVADPIGDTQLAEIADQVEGGANDGQALVARLQVLGEGAIDFDDIEWILAKDRQGSVTRTEVDERKLDTGLTQLSEQATNTGGIADDLELRHFDLQATRWQGGGP